MTTTFSLGDIVVPSPHAGWPAKSFGIRCVITKVPVGTRGVNYTATPCDADGQVIEGERGFRAPSSAFLVAADGNTSPAPVVTFIGVNNPPVGALVRANSESKIPAGIYVVIGETDAERVRIMRLGGGEGSYWRVYGKSLTVIDPKQAEAALAGL